MVDPDGEWVHLVVGAVIGGTVNLLVNWNKADNFWQGLGYFGVEAAAGALGAGIGAGVSSAIAGGSFGAGFVGSQAAMTATSSFASGAAIGGSSGFSGGFTSGLGNGLMGGQNFSGALWSGTKSGLIGGVSGGLIGGVAGGVDAVRDGRRFFDGATVQDQVLIDRQIPFVRQQGNMNCGPANCEAISRSRGGNVTQQSIRNAPNLGGNPNTTPLKDAHVLKEFSSQSGIKYVSAGRGLNANEALHYMRSGYDLTYNIKSVPGIGHAVTVNRITERTITKISGKVINKLMVEVMNPSVGQYVRISNSTLINAYNSFLIFP